MTGVLDRFVTALLLTATLVAGGCAGYTLQGKVVRGDFNDIIVVHELDERLNAPGIQNAEVFVRRDPGTPNQHLVGRDRAASDGSFAIPISEFGAGWMDEQWLVQSKVPGYQNTEALLKLPRGGKWRLLITMAPGTPSSVDPSRDFMDDFERFK